MTSKNLSGNKLLFSCIIAATILFLVLIFSNLFPFSSIFHYSNLGIRNILFSLDIPGKQIRIHPGITLVEIDNKTLADPDRGGL